MTPREQVDVMWTALGQAVEGDMHRAMVTFLDVMDCGPSATFAGLCGLASVFQQAVGVATDPDRPVVLKSLNVATGSTDIDEVPHHGRWVGRFLTAQVNGDLDTAFALFCSITDDDSAIAQGDPQQFHECVTALLSIVADAVRAYQAREAS